MCFMLKAVLPTSIINYYMLSGSWDTNQDRSPRLLSSPTANRNMITNFDSRDCLLLIINY
jgi:hypothetical protein